MDVVTGRVYGGTDDSGGPVHVNVGVLVGGIVAVDETINGFIVEIVSVGVLCVGKNVVALTFKVGVSCSGRAVYVV